MEKAFVVRMMAYVKLLAKQGIKYERFSDMRGSCIAASITGQ